MDKKKLSHTSLREEFILRRFSKSMKIYDKRFSKSTNIVQNGPLKAVRVDLLILFIDFGPCRKSMFFDVVLGLPKVDKNRALGRQGAAKCATIGQQLVTFGIGGRGVSRARNY